VAVAPLLYGAGVQNKVLEAMACARPVVATPRTMAPFEHAAREACLVADSPDQFAQAVLTLLGDAGLRARMGRAGRAYVQRRHDWGPLAGQLEGIYGGRQ
jgi:glycosyltransferase involved in cell wall biosynthesis